MSIQDKVEYQISAIVLPMQEKFTALDIVAKLKPRGFFADPTTVRHHLDALVNTGILTRRSNTYEVNMKSIRSKDLEE